MTIFYCVPSQSVDYPLLCRTISTQIAVNRFHSSFKSKMFAADKEKSAGVPGVRRVFLTQYAVDRLFLLSCFGRDLPFTPDRIKKHRNDQQNPYNGGLQVRINAEHDEGIVHHCNKHYTNGSTQ